MLRVIPLLVVLLLALPAIAQNSDPDASSTLIAAQEAFADARSTLETDPSAAKQLFARSALLFERVIMMLDYQNADLHYNHANALALSDQPGRAIAAYLRAQRLRPHDNDIAAGLAAARVQTPTHIDSSASIRITQALTIWRGFIPRSVLFWGALLGWLALWASAGLRLATRLRIHRSVLTACAIVAITGMGALILEQTLLYSEPLAVVVLDNTIGYNGPDAVAYDASFTTPLNQGIECVILEERDGWLHIALRSGSETWVLREHIERV